MKAVILAAGEGKRLWPLTNRRPKPMLPVVNKPILEYVVESLSEVGITEVVLVVGHQRDRIQRYFEDGDDWGVSIEYVVQEHQLGTGHAVLQAREIVEEDFMVLNGDRIIEPQIIQQVEETEDTPATVTATRVDEPREYGIIERTDNQLRQIKEEPEAHNHANMINAGVYQLPMAIFDILEQLDPNAQGELSLPEAINEFAEKQPVEVVDYRGMWTDISQLWDLPAVNDRMLDHIDGLNRGVVHDTAAVDTNSDVGRNTSIGPNSTIKSGTTIGDNVSIGANATIANSVILRDATIEDSAVIHDCIIGENVTIGMNTTIPGGYTAVVVEQTVHQDIRFGGVVGDNTTVGSNVVIKPGTIIGNSVTVGSGKIVNDRIESDTVIK